MTPTPNPLPTLVDRSWYQLQNRMRVPGLPKVMVNVLSRTQIERRTGEGTW
jgi:hypothetical protein